jgi:ABC-2 type transport system permease protein
VAASLAFAWGSLLKIKHVPEQHAVMRVGFVILFAINIFAAPDTMPAGLRAFAGANPISHLVTAERGLTAGQVLWALAATVPLTALFAPLTTTL